MNIYSFRTRVRRMRFKPCNYYEAYLIPTIVVGKNNEIDYRKTSVKFGDQEATLYYIDFLWLNFAFVLEFWGEREKAPKSSPDSTALSNSSNTGKKSNFDENCEKYRTVFDGWEDLTFEERRDRINKFRSGQW
jgi:hypothetical protein